MDTITDYVEELEARLAEATQEELDALDKIVGDCEQELMGQETESLDNADLADALTAYTTPGHPLYDPDFNREIRSIRPDWFPATESSGEIIS